MDKLVLRLAEELQFQEDSKETEDSEESDDHGDNYEDAMLILEGDEEKLSETGVERDVHTMIGIG